MPAPGRLPGPALPAGHGAALRLGAGHGVWCVGCCWALMLIAFAAGVANLWWMAALTALIALGLLALASAP